MKFQNELSTPRGYIDIISAQNPNKKHTEGGQLAMKKMIKNDWQREPTIHNIISGKVFDGNENIYT